MGRFILFVTSDIGKSATCDAVTGTELYTPFCKLPKACEGLSAVCWYEPHNPLTSSKFLPLPVALAAPLTSLIPSSRIVLFMICGVYLTVQDYSPFRLIWTLVGRKTLCIWERCQVSFVPRYDREKE